MADISHTFKQFIVFHKDIKCHSARTIGWYRDSIKDLVQSTAVCEIENIDAPLLYRYIFHLKEERHYSIFSVDTRLRAIRGFVNWARKHRYTQADPFAEVELPKLPEKVKEVLSIGQVKVILNFTLNHTAYTSFQKQRNYALISFFVHTGLRLRELANLKTVDVQLDEGLIFVREGKGGKDRVVAINHDLKKTLHNYEAIKAPLPDVTEFYFTQMDVTKGITEDSIKRVFQTIRQHTKIYFTPHTLRRTFATMMIEGGCDLFALQKMMGHSQIKTLISSYLKLSYNHLRQQVEKHPLVSPFD